MDKFLKALDITEHPEKYSEKELNAILEDPEVKEFYDLICDSDSALKKTPRLSEKEVEDEWNRFIQSKKRKIKFPKFISRRVAVGGIVILTSVAALAIGVGIVMKNSNSKVVKSTSIDKPSEVSQALSISNDSVMTVIPDSIPQSIIVFENEPLSMILDQISQYYGLKLDVLNKQAAANRFFFKWNKSEAPEEIVRQFNNFEIINLTLSDKTLILK